MAQRFDVVVLGGGLAGIAMACMLGRQGLNVALIEASDIKQKTAANSDGRVSAIALGSALILEKAGIWQHLEGLYGDILDIVVTDSDSSALLHYDHELVGNKPMGFMVKNTDILQASYKECSVLSNIILYDKQKFVNITNDSNKVVVTTDAGHDIMASLLIVADGKFSKAREFLGIKSTYLAYGQKAIVCNIAHDEHHNCIARECFLRAGPFAVLPMQGGYHSSLVWVEEANLADIYLKMDEEGFIDEIKQRIGDGLGNKITLASPRFYYELTLTHANNYFENRAVLIGDAAHGIHPLAGQGLNLALRDIDRLSSAIMTNYNLGLDITANAILDEYEKLRKFDVMALISITHGLNRLFASNNIVIKTARRFGMNAVDFTPLLKKSFMKHAMGIS